MDTKLLKLLKTVATTKHYMPVLAYTHIACDYATVSDTDVSLTIKIDSTMPIPDGIYDLNPFAKTSLPLDEYPLNLTKFYTPSDDMHTINIHDLQVALLHASTDETRFNLNGVAVTKNTTTKNNNLIATDGHRLFAQDYYKLSTDCIIIPYKACKKLIAYAQYRDFETVTLCVHDNMLANHEIGIRLCNADYPDCAQVVPKNIDPCAEIDLNLAIPALKRSILLTKHDKNHAIDLVLTTEEVYIVAHSTEYPSERFKIGNGSSVSEAIEINASYLLDAIKLEDKRAPVNISVSGLRSPIILSRSLIMPLKMGSVKRK